MHIDVNADLGEADNPGESRDEEILSHVSSANIACAGHAGTPETIRHTVRFAAAAGVVVGAHPGYPDRPRFGRVTVPMPANELKNEITRQIQLLVNIAEGEGVIVRYVKPHGALYHDAASDPRIAQCFLEGVLALEQPLAVLAPPSALFAAAARNAGLRTFTEAFADRAYQRDGTLVPRSRPDSMISDPQEIADRVVRIVLDRSVRTIEGIDIEVAADSICLHGDGTESILAARAISVALADGGITRKSFLA